MRLNEIGIMCSGKALLLKPEVYDPLRPCTGNGKARIDVRRSNGVMVSAEGIVEASPICRYSDIVCESDDIASLSRPNLPFMEWGLVRTAIAPYQATALNLPAVQFTVDVPEKEVSQVADYLGLQVNSGINRVAGHDVEGVLFAASETAEKLREGCLRILEEYREICRRKGAFCSPFFVVAALRMSDGSHSLASVPMLMQPVSASPMVRIDSAVVSNGRLRLELSIINAPCQLIIRVDETSVDDLTKQLATHLDIFVSEQAPWKTATYGARAPVLRTSADIFTHSGLSADYGSINRPQQLMNTSDTVPCLYYPRSDRENLGEWLCGTGKFYKVGEIPLDSISGYWTEVVYGELPTADETAAFIPDYTLHTEVTGGRVERINGLTCVVAPRLKLPHVGALKTLLQYDDRNNIVDVSEGSITVTGSKNGMSVQSRFKAVAGNDSLWKINIEVLENLIWIFYPDSDIRRLTIQTYNDKVTLKLRRHRTLSGAYWCGFLRDADKDKETMLSENIDIPESIESVYELPGSMLTSLEVCEGLFPASRILSFPTHTRLMGIAPALRSMSSGELGRFPLYAFTDMAVWAITPTENKGWRQVQPIALIGCDNRKTISATHTAVAFTGYGSLWLAEGAKVRCLLTSEILGSEITAVRFDAHHNRLMIATADRRVVLYCLERYALIGVAARDHEEQRCFVTMPIELPSALCVNGIACHGKHIDYTRLYAGNSVNTLRYVAGLPGHSLRHFSTAPVSLLHIEVGFSEV
ncbi:MAG: hypothetical protein K2H47_02815 [Muribaculaceae bacterium]|nr:hypothetical protein [Muribaculaceae bacterium]